MKKIFKRLSVIIPTIIVSFFIINVFAGNKLEIKEYIKDSYYTAVLYSDNKLYFWGYLDYGEGQQQNIIVENVKDIIKIGYNELGIIDNENNFKMIYFDSIYNNETDSEEAVIEVTDTLRENAKEVDSTHLLTNDNKLYKYVFNRYASNEENTYKEELVMNGVKEWSYNGSNGSYLLLDNSNKLYAYGRNIFGKKINDGEDITLSPILIAENIKEFSCDVYGYNNIEKNVYGNFYLTNDNELYIMSNELPYPKLLKKNVSKFLYDKYYVSEGKTYQIDYYIENDLFNIRKDELILNEELIYVANDRFYGYYWYLTKDGNLYSKELNKSYNNIKQIYNDSSNDYNIYMLTKTNELIYLKISREFNYNTHNYEYVAYQNTMLNKVKKIIDTNTFIMEDEIIYIKGQGNYDIADFNGTESINYKNFAVIKGLPNVPENINLSQINLNYNGKTDFVVGDTYDFYAELYPYNATNKELIWESSDENVATVTEKGTLTFISAGKTVIKVKSKSLNISDEIEITIHPKNSGIEILGGEEIKINKNKPALLKVKITPEGVLDQKIKWTSNAGKNEYNEDIIEFSGIYEEYYRCYEDVCPNSYDEVLIEANKSGTYIVTATTEDGLYSDTVTVNVEQGITSLSLNPDRNNMLGSTLYIYMSESNYMDLNVKIYPEDATDREVEYTSSDESIATVDNKGRITAKKSGKVAITYKAKNYDVKNTINVLIFDKSVSTKIGDVDGDGIVDILDLVKLRRHVAGVEAIQ